MNKLILLKTYNISKKNVNPLSDDLQDSLREKFFEYGNIYKDNNFEIESIALIEVGGQAVLGRQRAMTTPWLTVRHGYDLFYLLFLDCPLVCPCVKKSFLKVQLVQCFLFQNYYPCRYFHIQKFFSQTVLQIITK